MDVNDSSMFRDSLGVAYMRRCNPDEVINCYTCSATTDVVSTNMFGMMDASIHNFLFVCSSSCVFTVVSSERPHVVTDLEEFGEFTVGSVGKHCW